MRLKSNARRGGIIENIFMRRVEIGRVAEALLTVDFLYEEGPNGAYPPIVRNVVIENVTCQSSPRVFFINGFPGATIDRIRVANSIIAGVEATEVVQGAGRIELENVTIRPAKKVRSLSSRQLGEQ
jgi:unsaturated rhamnogalacturonyl hydrolase